MQSPKVFRFVAASVVLLLVLMPVWYLASGTLAWGVIQMAGQWMTWAFEWAKAVQIEGTVGVLRTGLVSVTPVPGSPFSVGELAPKADYRLFGYGMVLLWALVIASWPRHMLLKLLAGSLAMFVLQSMTLCVQWLHAVLNTAGPSVLRQTGHSVVLQEVVMFVFHFNLFIFSVLAPVLIWLLMDRAFVMQLWHSRDNKAPQAPSPPL